MRVRALALSKHFARVGSLALIALLAFAVAAPAPVMADAENSAFARQKRKKDEPASPATKNTNANTTQNPGSGVAATTESRIVNDGSMAPFVTPDSVAQMQAMADKYAKIVADGGWPQVTRGKLKKGSKGKPVAALNQRLFIEGYLQAEGTQGEFAELFTSATEDAVKRFQSNHGLRVNGVIDGPTQAALNVSAASRLATIRANLPRLAEYSKDLGSRYAVVNVPAQQIETVSGGKVYSIHNAIVGRPSRPTPVAMTPLTVIRFNPYWNAPASIVEKDILPRMMSKGPSKIMSEMNMKVFDGVGGPEVDPDTINWRKVRVDDYHFRQEPGGTNAMATAKIEFTSPFGIYLHDTPEPHLFKTGNRFYSSGCVRVENVSVFIDWVLQGQDGIDSARIAGLAESKERLDVNIANAPQLRVAYLTAWPANGGVAAFRSDIYDLDGSGFVKGQPLPVGETLDGQRYVLKPLPRLQEDIDTNDGVGFASMFSRRDKNGVLMPGQLRKSGDSLMDVSGLKAKQEAQLKKQQKEAEQKKKAEELAAKKKKADELAAKKKAEQLAAKKKKEEALAAKKKADEQAKLAAKKKADEKAKAAAAKKKADDKAKALAAKKKTDDKSKTAAAKKKTDDKTKTAAKKPATQTAQVQKKPAASTTAKKAPADCKPGKDGKLPAGCPAPAAAKKPPAKPEKTANAN
jgi:murein L,D-transpeptidase YcbB/YkuD